MSSIQGESPEARKARLAQENEEKKTAMKKNMAAAKAAANQPPPEYRYIPQGYGAILPIAPGPGEPSAVGTDEMAPCIGVYFQIGDNECFVAHLDSHTATTVEDRWKNIRKLAINTRDAFHARVVAAFPHAALDHLGALRLVVNQGDYPSYALAWGVSEAFKKMKDHGYVFHDPEEFSTNVTAVQALQVPDTMSGMGFAVDKVKNGNDIPVVWGLASNWVRKGQYGVAGFTFTDQ